MKIRRVGRDSSSIIMTLPIAAVRQLGWKPGDEVYPSVQGKKLVITKVGEG